MESNSQRAQNKKSLLSVGVLMLSLAALQSPLWRVHAGHTEVTTPIVVRSGGATLITSDGPIAGIAVDRNQQASAELVGDREVLVRGKLLGETGLMISSKDGHTSAFRVIVQSESARSAWGLSNSR